MAIQLFLIDEHNLVRSAFRIMLEMEDDMHVVGESSNGREAIQQIREMQPDVVLTETTMKALNGIDTTRRICTEFPNVSVLGVSSRNERPFITQMLRAGASGYVLKSCQRDELIQAVRSVSRGMMFLCPGATDLIVRSVAKLDNIEEETVLSELSQRERQVATLLTEGKAIRDIGNLLGLAEGTVDSHRRRILRKLEMENVVQLTRHAIQQGWANAAT